MPETLASGRYVRLVREGRWEWCERVNARGVVVIAALTPAGEVVLVEQHRHPVRGRVIEMPAGLAGDVAGAEDEELAEAARRELEEETGWRAGRMEKATAGPVSAGLTSEILTFFVARELERVADGGGDETEDITVHLVPLDDAGRWLEERAADGVMADPKVYAGLWFLRE
jgi:ADP-ribose pyrophosphatase